MSWTNIPKPTGTTYTPISHGFVYYDDQTIAYDDANTTYDGLSGGTYVNITKPTGTSWTNITKPS